MRFPVKQNGKNIRRESRQRRHSTGAHRRNAQALTLACELDPGFAGSDDFDFHRCDPLDRAGRLLPPRSALPLPPIERRLREVAARKSAT